MSQQIMDTHNRDLAEVVVPKQNTIRKALKAVKYAIAAVCIMCGMVEGTASLASTIPRRETRYGKLTLVNDTISPKLIYLIPPSGASRPRYAYLPGCTKRELQNEYSTAWGITTGYGKTIQIREIGSGRLVGEASQTDSRGMGVRCMKREVIDKMVRAAESKGREVENQEPRVQNIAVRDGAAQGLHRAGYEDGYKWLRFYSSNIRVVPEEMKKVSQLYPQWVYSSEPYKNLVLRIKGICIQPQTCTAAEEHNKVVENYTRDALLAHRRGLMETVQTIATEEKKDPDIDDLRMNDQLINMIYNSARQDTDMASVRLVLKTHLQTKCGMSVGAADFYAEQLLTHWRAARKLYSLHADVWRPMSVSRGHNNVISVGTSGVVRGIDSIRPGCAVEDRKKGGGERTGARGV
jgi:hypothetical protein